MVCNASVVLIEEQEDNAFGKRIGQYLKKGMIVYLMPAWPRRETRNVPRLLKESLAHWGPKG